MTLSLPGGSSRDMVPGPSGTMTFTSSGSDLREGDHRNHGKKEDDEEQATVEVQTKLVKVGREPAKLR